MTDIVPAEMADLDEIVDCWVRLADGQREHDSHLLADENREAIRESVGHHVVSGNLLVARPEGGSGERSDRVEGFVMFGLQSDSYERDVTRGVVRNLYVRPGARNRGLGSELMAAAERRMAEAGADVVALEVMADNEAARRLYRRRGYEPHRVGLEKPVGSDTHTN